MIIEATLMIASIVGLVVYADSLKKKAKNIRKSHKHTAKLYW